LFSDLFNFDLKSLFEIDNESSTLITQLRSQGGFRGFGYWVWKPAIFFWALKHFPNDHIVYVDAGSHILSSTHVDPNFQTVLKIAEDNGALAFNLPGHNDMQWTKSDLIKVLQPSQQTLIANQVQAGFISLPPSKERTLLMNDWRDLSLIRNGFYFTDESEMIQSSSFIEHRHDQSALSLLWKGLNLYSEEDKTYPTIENRFPLLASRDNTGLKYGSSASRYRFEHRFNSIADLALHRN